MLWTTQKPEQRAHGDVPRLLRGEATVRSGEHFNLSVAALDGRRQITVRAGRCRTERVVPPAGEEHAFDREIWDREVAVYVSATGRSVRVWIDGVEVKFDGHGRVLGAKP